MHVDICNVEVTKENSLINISTKAKDRFCSVYSNHNLIEPRKADRETNLTSQRPEITHQHPAGGGTRGQITVVDLPRRSSNDAERLFKNIFASPLFKDFLSM